MGAAARKEPSDWPPGALVDIEELRPRPTVHLLLLVIAAAFVSFLAWAAVATLDEVTRAQGRVIPSRQVQQVQHLEGGIVADILVREGDRVEEGELLLRIDNLRAASDYREKKARYLALLAAIARLEAEAEEAERIRVPEEVEREAPELARSEEELFRARKEALASRIEILARQVEQREQELAELAAGEERVRRSLALLREELAISERLAGERLVARAELLRLRRQVAELEGELSRLEAAVPRARAALAEARERIANARSEFRSRALKELAALRSELAGIRPVVVAGEDRVRRTEVRSPVRGVIKKLYITTRGGVVQPGQVLVDIVPLDDSLLVEASVPPRDIAFIRPGQPARVKITAYDYAVYGGLEGRVEHISADTLVDARGQSYYLIRVRTERNYLGSPDRPLAIIPGMTAEVDILTGQKTVLDYLLKPVVRAREEALRER